MPCPQCPDRTLVTSERSGIEIDPCPQCCGVWLQRSEIDKLIGRALPALAPAARAPFFAAGSDRGERQDRGPRPGAQRTRLRPRKSWLSEVFD